MTDVRRPMPLEWQPRCVALATDFSETSEYATEYACGLAAAYGGKVYLLHVIEDPRSAPGGAEFWSTPLATLTERLEQSARTRLARVVALRQRQVPIEPVLRIGEAFVEIARYAREREADLLVLGTHGRGPVGQMLMGSVAEKVVRTAPCPVLTVRHPDREFALVWQPLAPATVG